jgi:hypothetical protein
MSRTYEFYCKDCNVNLWIGQSHTNRDTGWYIYQTLENTNKQERFLMEHRGHSLIFEDSEIIHSEYDESVEFMGEPEEINESLTVLNPIKIDTSIRVMSDETQSVNSFRQQ